MKRTFCIILSALLLFSALLSCKRQPTPPSQTSTQPTETTTTAPELWELVGNLEDYTIISSEDAGSIVKSAVTHLRNTMLEQHNVKMKVDTDWVRKGSQPDPSAKEVLVGATNRPESAEVISSLPHGAYAIRHVGNKIVIAAHTADNMALAMEHFLTRCVQKNGDFYTVVSEFTSESAPNLFDVQNPFESYTVVYDTSNKYQEQLAKSFCSSLYAKFGTRLSTKDISTAPEAHEIVIATEGREEISAALADVDKNGYTASAVGQKLIVTGCDTVALTFAVNELIDSYIENTCTDSFNLPNNTALKGSLINEYTEGGDDTARAEGTNLRIMTFNILSEWWNDMLPIEGRDTIVNATLHAYRPDIAGLEETTPNWLKAIQAGLVPNYKTSSGKMEDGKSMNVNVLVYNAETVQLLEEGVIPYSNAIERKADYIRNLTWGRFRRISDGAEFIVTVTHWDTDAAARAEHAVEHARFIDELEEKYGCPIITTGDYNASETKDEFKNYLALTGFQNARFDAEICNRQQYQTSHKVGSAPNKGGSIDNITATRDVKIKYYNILTFPKVLEASDHCPVYVDAILK